MEKIAAEGRASQLTPQKLAELKTRAALAFDQEWERAYGR